MTTDRSPYTLTNEELVRAFEVALASGTNVAQLRTALLMRLARAEARFAPGDIVIARSQVEVHLHGQQARIEPGDTRYTVFRGHFHPNGENSCWEIALEEFRWHPRYPVFTGEAFEVVEKATAR